MRKRKEVRCKCKKLIDRKRSQCKECEETFLAEIKALRDNEEYIESIRERERKAMDKLFERTCWPELFKKLKGEKRD